MRRSCCDTVKTQCQTFTCLGTKVMSDEFRQEMCHKIRWTKATRSLLSSSSREVNISFIFPMRREHDGMGSVRISFEQGKEIKM
jgi:hypothetical protein